MEETLLIFTADQVENMEKCGIRQYPVAPEVIYVISLA